MSNIMVEILEGVIIIKERKTPIYLLMLEAAKRRVPVKHPSRSLLEEELWKQQAGLRGEKTLDYYLSLLSKNESLTLTNLRLANKSSYFQIDTLVMTTRYILLLESKNFAGELIYQASSNQLTQAKFEKELVSYDPISQVERHKLQLLEFLQVLQLPAIPVLTLVVLTNSYTTLKSNPEYVKIPSNIVRAEALPMKLADINRINRKEFWSTRELKKVANLLKNRNVSYEPNVLAKFKVSKEDLIKGVHCPSCLVIGMKGLGNGIWQCPNCEYKSIDPYKYTLNDYYLLINKEITNRDFREFIGGLSVVTASRYLSKLNLKRTGKLKSTKYHLELFS